jgi:hypothetical protein
LKLFDTFVKMRYSTAAATLLYAAAYVQAATFTVSVGANNTLAFSPTSLSNVSNGDIVNFQFVSKNHSVVQSSFAAPCTGNGVSSGFQDVTDTSGASGFPTWSITVENASAPLWFYCSQTTANSTHCQAGMVFAINPTEAKSFDAYQAAAKATNATAPAPGQNPSPVTIINGAAGATDSVVSVSGIATATGSGAGSSTGSSSGSAASSTSTSNSASQLMSGSSISLLAVAGLVTGLIL